MADSQPNLYLNFKFYRDRLERQLLDIRKVHSDRLFPYLKKNTNILVYFVQTIFELGIKKDFYISNTSLKDDDFNLSIRPKRVSRLDDEFPEDITLCIRGRLFPRNHPSPEFTVERIVDISESPKRHFEREVIAVPAFSEGERSNNLLSDHLIFDLPEISRITRENLKKWKAYLAWKREIVEQQLAGIRYVHADLVENAIRLVTAAENENDFKEFEKILQKEDLMAFPKEYSKDPWQFKYNKTAKNLFGAGMGRFKRAREVSRTTMVKALKGCPWQKPYVAEVLFELNEDDNIEYEAMTRRNQKEIRNYILKKLPETGFLAVSLIGEFALINRQMQALENLELESGYAPFLSSWLFDIGKANTPQITQPVESWLMKNINEDQQKAVKKMLGAPDVALMQGPPGTGKTTVIGEAIYQFVCQGKKVVLASQANLAVDNALEKLASVPEIRAIRLGRSRKFSPGGQQFAEDRVLKKFYGSIADACETSWLGEWRESDLRLETIRKQLADLENMEDALSGLNQEIAALQEKQKQDKVQAEKSQAADEPQDPRIVLKTELEKLVQFLKGQLDLALRIPDKLMELIRASIITNLEQLTKYKIDLRPEDGADFDQLSASEKSRFFQTIFQNWSVLKSNIPNLLAEINRLQKTGTRVSFDPENRMLLNRLNKKLDQVEMALENGDDSQLNIWRQLRRKIQTLESRATLDPALYAAIFNLRENGTPFYQRLEKNKLDREKLAAFLTLTLKGIRNVEQRIEKSNQLLVENIENIITRLDAAIQTAEKKDIQEADFAVADNGGAALAEAYQERETALQSHIKKLKDANIIEEADPDGKLAKVKNELNEKIQALEASREKDADFRSKWEPLLTAWADWLRDDAQIENDNEHFIETYVDNCNVVGITCNENPRLLHGKRQSCFDVAIIDEVSKATPPELLLPMLMAKKSILVGDHRQLPPLFKEREDSSWQELLQTPNGEEISPLRPKNTLLTKENFLRFREMVTASLFKEYFENAPGAIKSRLEIQYRMHPDIMDVINHFYDYKLKCGLADPDDERNHQLNVPAADGMEFITPNTHAVWIDTSKDPLNRDAFETQSGTSKMNVLEATLIIETLKKIDEASQLLGFNDEKRKEVGVISFYGRQVGEIRRRLRREKFEALDIVVNTVDQFQGKEKPIILVSLVRNTRSGMQAKNAFVTQFERINVAFSRAQELLMIFGARNMFSGLEIELPHMDQSGGVKKQIYGDIIEGLNRKSRFWKSSRVVSQQEWHRLNGR